MITQFYTYIHCKPNGDPFYVGKGSGKRAYTFSKRSVFHKNIISKYGKENILVYTFDCKSEEQAFSDEIQQIAQLKKEGYLLVNFTNGGEGTSGYIRSIESIARSAASHLGKKRSKETCENISTAKKGKTKGRVSNRKGCKCSDDTKIKNSIASKKLWEDSEYRKKVLVKSGVKRGPYKKKSIIQ